MKFHHDVRTGNTTITLTPGEAARLSEQARQASEAVLEGRTKKAFITLLFPTRMVVEEDKSEGMANPDVDVDDRRGL